MEITTHTYSGVDKTTRYGWVTKDEPGTLQMLHKDLLQIHPAYQRDVLPEKVKSITASWSWLSLGALVVGKRGGDYWVIDGQHRALAAKRRSDIESLPCVVFDTADVREEARGFIDLNTGRKPVTAVAKQKALVAAGDDIAVFIQQECDALGIEIKRTAVHARQIKCVGWCNRRAADNKDVFRKVLAMGAELSQQDNMPIAERVLEGLWLLNARCGKGLADERLANRLRAKGARVLLDAANRAAAYYASGGGKVWAEGMLAELNKGLQNKFTMDGAKE
jgi:ParB-like chromosome segregation protein Spo0J